jgi:hypothetical protein
VDFTGAVFSVCAAALPILPLADLLVCPRFFDKTQSAGWRLHTPIIARLNC